MIQTSSLEYPGFLRDGSHQKTKLEFWDEKREMGGVVLWVLTYAMIGSGCSPWNHSVVKSDSGCT